MFFVCMYKLCIGLLWNVFHKYVLRYYFRSLTLGMLSVTVSLGWAGAAKLQEVGCIMTSGSVRGLRDSHVSDISKLDLW